jgi:hypothetical protein
MKALTRNQMIRALMLEEQGKSEMKIHDLRQVLADLSDWIWKDPRVILLLLDMGKKREKRRVNKPKWWEQYL